MLCASTPCVRVLWCVGLAGDRITASRRRVLHVQAIYPECFATTSATSYTVAVSVDASEGVVLRGGEDGSECVVRHLPAIQLAVTMVSTYPASSPPAFAIEAAWLAPHRSSVVAQLVQQYDDGGGAVCVFTWINWLQNDLLSFIGRSWTVDPAGAWQPVARDPRRHTLPAACWWMCVLCVCRLRSGEGAGGSRWGGIREGVRRRTAHV